MITKVDQLNALMTEVVREDLLIKPSETVKSIENSHNLKDTFRTPNCARCTRKCCPSGIGLSLSDIARFMDNGLESFITGTFEGYLELLSSGDIGADLPIPRVILLSSGKAGCVFFDEKQECSIYEIRPVVCQVFPLVLRQDKDAGWILCWSDVCQSYRIHSDVVLSQRMLERSIQLYNEKLKNVMLLVRARKRLMDIGFGKYLI